MEADDEAPVPTPRTRGKAPVPLPRTILNCPGPGPSPTDDQELDDTQTNPFLQYSSIRRAARELRRVTSNVQERSSAVIGSMRNMLPKRMSLYGVPGDDVKSKEPEDEFQTQSLPGEDLFRSISFGSPLTPEALDEPDSPPPPAYPPPPLPDESIYDEISSTRSSNHYEELPQMKKLSLAESDCSLGAASLALERADSWNFYDVAHGVNKIKVQGPSYENVALEDSVVEITENLYSGEPSHKGPEVPVKNSIVKPKKTLSLTESQSSKSVSNDCYENWTPVLMRDVVDEVKPLSRSVTTRSVIYEFDPLFEERQRNKLKKMKEEGKEGKPVLDLSSIPPPPLRSDSLPETENPPCDTEYFLYHRIAGNSSFFVADDFRADLLSAPKEPKKKSSLVRWTTMKRAIKMVTDAPWTPVLSRKNSKVKDFSLKFPFSQSPHSGYLLKSPSNGEKLDFVQKWCQLAEGNMTLSSDKNSSSKEVIPLENILSIHSVINAKQESESEAVHCWEVSVTGRSKPHLFSSKSAGDTRMWMRRLLESLTNVFPTKLTSSYSRAGQCFLKEGISGEWTGAWILLSKRVLHYCQMKEKPKEVDLRKARLIVLQKDDGGCANVAEPGSYIQVHTVDRVLYLQMDNERETKAWKQAVKHKSVETGPLLTDQQLTKDDVPVIVDKCINFVYAHGSMSEGIYRRSGSTSNVNKLMSLLRADSWSVQLSRADYTEHDVSTVLKRFFRELPEPLLMPTLHKYFCNASHAKCSKNEKIGMYRAILEKLPPINYVTTRRLIGHLHFVAQQAEKNRMPAENLAAIWAPTLMSVEGKRGAEWSKKECDAINDLITHYKGMFLVDCEEVDREKRILEVLERVHTSPNLPPAKPSGDLKIPVFIGSNRGECVTIVVSPSLAAGEVCKTLAGRTEYDSHELCLSEMVLAGALSRPLHHAEKVLDVALRWAYWDSSDCKDNYLVLAPNSVFREIIPLAKPPLSKCGELKFADSKNKSFKNYIFEFSQAKLIYYKDKACSHKIGEWKIEDIIWYIGHEPKRNPQSRWAITFIKKSDPVKRTKENPYFGYTIAGTSREDQLQWMAAMLLGQFQHSDLLPRPALI